jgi:uncharacterized membrane protein
MKNLFYTYFLIGIIVFSFVLNPFSKKEASKNLNSHEYFMINHLMLTLLVIIYGIYLFYNNKCDISCLKKMSNKQVLWGIFAAIIGMIGSLALIMVIQMDEITFIIPNIQPLVILIGALVGYFIFKESMRTFKIIGIILIICGAFCINYDKIKKDV